MLLSGKLGKVGSTSSNPPLQELFLSDLKIAIEDMHTTAPLPSTYYAPSGMNCIRQMYYKRIGTVPDSEQDLLYSDIGMADTGTRRHEAIQEALEFMSTQPHCRFQYVDVAQYVKEKQDQGICQNLVVKGKRGSETELWHKRLDINFRCDGIILDKLENHFYLFEFKNQISFKASNKTAVDLAHHNQVTVYCALLDLQDAFVVYENRDNCNLYCPEVYHVSEYEKAQMLKKIKQCEEHVRQKVVPDIPESISQTECKYCRYKHTCRLNKE